jgi:hypothetical protein
MSFQCNQIFSELRRCKFQQLNKVRKSRDEHFRNRLAIVDKQLNGCYQ